MKLSSILALEASEEVKIYLHREGLFWKAYERSAFLLLRETGKNYQVKCRQQKSTGDIVRSVGFPDSVLHQLFPADALHEVAQSAEEGEHSQALWVEASHADLSDFAVWRAEHDVEELNTDSANKSSKANSRAGNDATALVMQRLSAFDLANSTPIDCLRFVASLKEISSHGM